MFGCLVLYLYTKNGELNLKKWEPILEEKQKFNQLLIWLPMIAL